MLWAFEDAHNISDNYRSRDLLESGTKSPSIDASEAWDEQKFFFHKMFAKRDELLRESESRSRK